MSGEVYILFHFNIILKHNGMSTTKVLRYFVLRRFGMLVLWEEVKGEWFDEV